MKARAPGKVVISGAYAVLTGAPAIVTAVDRYASADTSQAAGFVTEEMRAAAPGPYPSIDASELRHEGRKLGLGSSAALLVAALASIGSEDPSLPSTRRLLFERALHAHRKAQGGGSGVDVAASTFGGTLCCRLSQPLLPAASEAFEAPLLVDTLTLPRLALQIWASPSATSTSQYIRQVSAWRERAPGAFSALFGRLTNAAERAVSACTASDPGGFVRALDEQGLGLLELGEQSGCAIFLPELVPLAKLARAQGGCLLPAGAGGGDISLFAGLSDPSPELAQAMQRAGLSRLTLHLNAPGVHWV